MENEISENSSSHTWMPRLADVNSVTYDGEEGSFHA